MDGFFTDAEMASVVEYIEVSFGKLTAHPLVYPYSQHVFILTNMLSLFLKHTNVERFVKLAAMLGFEHPHAEPGRASGLPQRDHPRAAHRPAVAVRDHEELVHLAAASRRASCFLATGPDAPGRWHAAT